MPGRVGGATVVIASSSRGTVVAERAEVARTWWARGKVLLGRRGLPEGGGLVIAPCASIHTWFMASPSDAVSVATDGRALRRARALRPCRFGPPARGVHPVIELPAGALVRSGTVADDHLTLRPGPLESDAGASLPGAP